VNDDDTSFRGNGWTKYQQLVLSELKRHEAKQEQIQQQIVTVQINQGKIDVTLGTLQTELRRLSSLITTIEDDWVEKFDELDEARESTVLDVNKIKWKIGSWAAGFSVAAAAVFEILLTLFGR
jgi:chromosome segregation ATPase